MENCQQESISFCRITPNFCKANYNRINITFYIKKNRMSITLLSFPDKNQVFLIQFCFLWRCFS